MQKVTVYVRKIHVALFLCAEKALLNFCDMIYQTADFLVYRFIGLSVYFAASASAAS